MTTDTTSILCVRLFYCGFTGKFLAALTRVLPFIGAKFVCAVSASPSLASDEYKCDPFTESCCNTSNLFSNAITFSLNDS